MQDKFLLLHVPLVPVQIDHVPLHAEDQRVPLRLDQVEDQGGVVGVVLLRARLVHRAVGAVRAHAVLVVRIADRADEVPDDLAGVRLHLGEVDARHQRASHGFGVALIVDLGVNARGTDPVRTRIADPCVRVEAPGFHRHLQIAGVIADAGDVVAAVERVDEIAEEFQIRAVFRAVRQPVLGRTAPVVVALLEGVARDRDVRRALECIMIVDVRRV